jgi:hypothetical protein
VAAIYAEHEKRMEAGGIKRPDRGRPKRPNWMTIPASRKGLKVADIPELLDEWDWDFNGDLDPYSLPASSKKMAAWQCVLNPDHTWETRVASRTFQGSFCPYHMRVRVHPSESLAALYPEIALEWQANATGLHPDQVSFGSRAMVTWRCRRAQHEWQTMVFARTRGDGCPKCYAEEASARTKVGIKRAKKKLDATERAKIRELVEREVEQSQYELELAQYELTFPVPEDEDF